MSEHTPKLEQCVEETTEGSRKSQLVLHSKKPTMNTEGLMVEAGLLVSSHSSPSASPNQKSASSDHAPKIEGKNERCGADTSKVEGGNGSGSDSGTGRTGHSTRTGEDGSSGTGKTGHSTRTKRKHKTVTHKRQHGELR